MDMNRNIISYIMDQDALKPFIPIIRKRREGLLYLFCGGITFSISMGMYVLLLRVFHIHELVSNAVSWMSGVLFSFFATKKWVFVNDNWDFRFILGQIRDFIGTRIATLLLQEVLLYICIAKMGWNDVVVKIFTEMINIVLNYLVSKFLIFADGTV